MLIFLTFLDVLSFLFPACLSIAPHSVSIFFLQLTSLFNLLFPFLIFSRFYCSYVSLLSFSFTSMIPSTLFWTLSFHRLYYVLSVIQVSPRNSSPPVTHPNISRWNYHFFWLFRKQAYFWVGPFFFPFKFYLCLFYLFIISFLHSFFFFFSISFIYLLLRILSCKFYS